MQLQRRASAKRKAGISFLSFDRLPDGLTGHGKFACERRAGGEPRFKAVSPAGKANRSSGQACMVLPSPPDTVCVPISLPV